MISQLYAQVSILYSYIIGKDPEGLLTAAENLLMSFANSSPGETETIDALVEITDLIRAQISHNEELEILKKANESGYKN